MNLNKKFTKTQYAKAGYFIVFCAISWVNPFPSDILSTSIATLFFGEITSESMGYAFIALWIASMVLFLIGWRLIEISGKTFTFKKAK
jgi:ABC-type multidrug transport system permease subunit